MANTDVYNVTIANDNTAPLSQQVRQNRGYVGYFKSAGGTVVLGDELIQTAKLVMTRTPTKKQLLAPKGGPKRLAFELVDSTEVGVDVTTVQKGDEWKAAFSGGAANQWHATIGPDKATVTDLGKALAGGTTGLYVLAEAFDETEGTIYVFPFSTLTKTDTPDIDGLPGVAYQVRAIASATSWPVPAVLQDSATTLDGNGVSVGIAIDAKLTDFPAILTAVLGAS